MKRIEMTGKRFSRLVVVGIGPAVKNNRLWRCVCDCGGFKIVRGCALRSGATKSCGCLSKEIKVNPPIKHGGGRRSGKSPLYSTFLSMHARCENKNKSGYVHYGGRGIMVCSRWSGCAGFDNFRHDMGDKPTPKHTLERIDNNKGYSKENCRWATRLEQSQNRRANRFIEYNGVTKTLTGWACVAGVHASTLSYRLKNGWELDRAIGSAAAMGVEWRGVTSE